MQRTAAASQPGSNKLRLRVGGSRVIAQVDVLVCLYLIAVFGDRGFLGLPRRLLWC